MAKPIAAAVVLIAAFLLGFIPQYQKASRLEQELLAREQQLNQLQRDAGLSKARDMASLLYLELTRKNYGIAAQHATAFFSAVRAIIAGTSDAGLKSELEKVVSLRDSVVASIARSDPAVETQVRDILERMHQLTPR